MVPPHLCLYRAKFSNQATSCITQDKLPLTYYIHKKLNYLNNQCNILLCTWRYKGKIFDVQYYEASQNITSAHFVLGGLPSGSDDKGSACNSGDPGTLHFQKQQSSICLCQLMFQYNLWGFNLISFLKSLIWMSHQKSLQASLKIQ